jgi:hypothetical protein
MLFGATVFNMNGWDSTLDAIPETYRQKLKRTRWAATQSTDFIWRPIKLFRYVELDSIRIRTFARLNANDNPHDKGITKNGTA